MNAFDKAEIIIGFLMIVMMIATPIFMSAFAIYILLSSLFLTTISVYGGIGRNFENSHGGPYRNFESLRISYNAKTWGDRY